MPLSGFIMGHARLTMWTGARPALERHVRAPSVQFYRGASFTKRQRSRILKEETVVQYASENTKRPRRLYVWGYCATGALGQPKLVEQPVKPDMEARKMVRIPYNMTYFGKNHLKVQAFGCGYGFTVYGVKPPKEGSVRLYGCGINTSSQLGCHKNRKGNLFDLVASPLPIALPLTQPHHTAITHIACGRQHTVVATDTEGVFSLGSNAHGQCGRPIIEDEIYRGSQVIHKVSFDKQVEKVVCGQDHTLLLTSQGEVYSCGLGSDGQTGLGHYEATGELSRVEGDIKHERIVELASAADCVLAVSEKGEVFGWGNSEYGQLASGASNTTQVAVPVHLNFRSHVGHVTKVAAAGSMCAAVNREGQLYVWGYGILGKGPHVSQADSPTLIPETLFGKNEFARDVRVVDVSAGMHHLAATTNTRELFTWGRNKYGMLGLGLKHDMFFPFKVQVPAEVEQVRCGVDHMVVIARPFA